MQLKSESLKSRSSACHGLKTRPLLPPTLISESLSQGEAMSIRITGYETHGTCSYRWLQINC